MAFTTTDQHESGMSANSVEKEKAHPLDGMKAICAYVGKSEGTVLRYIREEAFPAKKICGTWISDGALVDAWRQGLLWGRTEKSIP